MRYIGVLEKEPETLWGIWFPDLPGCVTAAPTMDEAVSQASEALSLWADLAAEDGVTLPSPRTHSELMADAEVKAAIGKGDILIAVPFVQENGRPARANISLDAGLLKAIDAAAKERHLTRSAFIASTMRDKIMADV